MTGKRQRALWFCEECAPEQVKGSEECALCCGYRIVTTPEDLTPPQRTALVELLALQAEGKLWHPSWSVDKRALYALERRGLVVSQRYQTMSKLTPAGVRLAEAVEA